MHNPTGKSNLHIERLGLRTAVACYSRSSVIGCLPRSVLQVVVNHILRFEEEQSRKAKDLSALKVQLV